MLDIRQDLELFKVGHNVTKYNVCHDLTGNRSEGDGSVVRVKWPVSVFEDGMYVRFFLVLRDISIFSKSEKDRCRNGAISWAAFFSTQHRIRSGETAFLTSRLLNSFAILTVSKCNWEMLGKACGREHLNYTDKRSAFFLVSCSASPFPFTSSRKRYPHCPFSFIW